ncbi:MAG: hypothetical protein R2877_06915 [Bdellovibrionota bacterium]
MLLTVGMQKKSLEGIPMVGGFLLDVFTLGRIDGMVDLASGHLHLLIFVFCGWKIFQKNGAKFNFLEVLRFSAAILLWRTFKRVFDFLFQKCIQFAGGFVCSHPVFADGSQ